MGISEKDLEYEKKRNRFIVSDYDENNILELDPRRDLIEKIFFGFILIVFAFGNKSIDFQMKLANAVMATIMVYLIFQIVKIYIMRNESAVDAKKFKEITWIGLIFAPVLIILCLPAKFNEVHYLGSSISLLLLLGVFSIELIGWIIYEVIKWNKNKNNLNEKNKSDFIKSRYKF